MRRPRGRRGVRHGLLGRLLLMCVAIAACSITATAWAAAVSTTGSIERQYRDDFTVGATIFDSVLGYAATHASWSEAAPFLTELEQRTQRSIQLTDESGAVIYGGAADATGAVPVTVVNPLAVAPYPGSALAVGTAIDSRAVGPFRLTEAEAQTVRREAERAVDCLAGLGITATLTSRPNGRTVIAELYRTSEVVLPPVATPTPSSSVELPSPESEAPAVVVTRLPSDDPLVDRAVQMCGTYRASSFQPSEIGASRTFVELVNPCLERNGGFPLGTGVFDVDSLIRHTDVGTAERTCYDAALRELVTPYVAPPALLSITAQTSVPVAGGLSADARSRIALISLVILLLTTVVCVVVGSRVIRPLDALAHAAARIGRGDRSARVRSTNRGQIGELAASFNRMARELDDAEERRKHMVSDVAHELRTPLGNIRGWLEAAQDGVVALDDKLVTSLLDESVLLQRIVDDLQDLSLADAGELTFHPEPLRVADILAQVAAAHRTAADQAGVTLTVICREPIEFTADGARLRQAIGNLVGNAIRYTPAQGLVILRAERAAAPRERPYELVDAVDIEVSDTGLGIEPELLPHVFDRFWRAEQSRSRLSGGSGLGLSIARHLVEAQGGQISVRSSPAGGGTVFTIRMPVRE